MQPHAVNVICRIYRQKSILRECLGANQTVADWHTQSYSDSKIYLTTTETCTFVTFRKEEDKEEDEEEEKEQVLSFLHSNLQHWFLITMIGIKYIITVYYYKITTIHHTSLINSSDACFQVHNIIIKLHSFSFTTVTVQGSPHRRRVFHLWDFKFNIPPTALGHLDTDNRRRKEKEEELRRRKRKYPII